MSASKGLLWLLNKLWLSLAIVLVLAAVLMSALRYALPHIPDVSEQLEAQLEARLQQPIEISSLAMSWHRQGPALDVTGIQLAGQTDSPVQVDVGQVSVVLDFWQSLLQQQLVAQEFILNQATIDIDLQGLQAQDGEALNLDTLESLFLQQLERFSLTESELNVINLAGNRRSIVIERLSGSIVVASTRGLANSGCVTLPVIVSTSSSSWMAMISAPSTVSFTSIQGRLISAHGWNNSCLMWISPSLK